MDRNKTTSLRIAACGLALLLAWVCQAAAQSVVLLPSKSNTLIQVSDANSQPLSNGQGDIFVGRTNQDGQGPATISIRRGLIDFNVAATIPAGATITAVVMTVDDVQGLNGNQTISLRALYRDWGQGSSFFSGGSGAPAANGDATWYDTFYNPGDPAASPTWSAPGGLSGVDYSAVNSATAVISAGAPQRSFSWSSTTNPALLTDVQQWLDRPATNFGWIMLGNEDAGQTAKRFGGQSAVAPEMPPQLIIQYASPWIWTGSAGDDAWTTPDNWTSQAGIPGSGAAIVLGDSRTTVGTVDLLSSAPSISHLTINANKIISITSSVSGGGRLTLDNGISPAAIIISGSGHMIDDHVAILLNSDACITTNGSGDSIGISSDIRDGAAAHGIVKNGLGTLILSGNDSYSGGTSVEAGTLIVASDTAIADGSSLTVGDVTAFAPLAPGAVVSSQTMPVSAAITPVPEPGTFGLLAAGGLAAIAVSRRRRRSCETHSRDFRDESLRSL